jgi:hypothetical protein
MTNVHVVQITTKAKADINFTATNGRGTCFSQCDGHGLHKLALTPKEEICQN